MTRSRKAGGGLSQRAYARRRGVSPEAVSKAVREGRISLAADGTIDAERADREWQANTHPANGNGATRSLVGVRIDRESVRLARELLDLQRERGEVVAVEVVRRDAFNAARAARDRLGLVTSRLMPLLIPLIEPGQEEAAERLVEAELTAVMEDLGSVGAYGRPPTGARL